MSDDRRRERIEAALETARRPTTLPGERAAAVAAAERMIAAGGLDRATFAFPGEAAPAKPPPSRFSDDLFRRPRAPEHYTREDLDDVFRRFREHMASAARGASDFADAFSMAAEAMARQQAMQAEMARAARERREKAERDEMAKVAAGMAGSFLWNRDPPVRVYQSSAAPDGSRRWTIPDRDSREYTDDGLIEVAKAHGWGAVDVEEVLDRAVEYLRSKGVSVVRVAGGPAHMRGPLYRIDGELCNVDRVIFSARLRGFET